jgi:hypothetical protein
VLLSLISLLALDLSSTHKHRKVETQHLIERRHTNAGPNGGPDVPRQGALANNGECKRAHPNKDVQEMPGHLMDKLIDIGHASMRKNPYPL